MSFAGGPHNGRIALGVRGIDIDIGNQRRFDLIHVPALTGNEQIGGQRRWNKKQKQDQDYSRLIYSHVLLRLLLLSWPARRRPRAPPLPTCRASYAGPPARRPFFDRLHVRSEYSITRLATHYRAMPRRHSTSSIVTQRVHRRTDTGNKSASFDVSLSRTPRTHTGEQA